MAQMVFSDTQSKHPNLIGFLQSIDARQGAVSSVRMHLDMNLWTVHPCRLHSISLQAAAGPQSESCVETMSAHLLPTDRILFWRSIKGGRL
jgi:hypothetical protein